MTKTQVLIAGGGPVGMTLALELARYGVPSILVERNATTTRHPKMDLTNGRTMELFARLNITEKLRDAGVPRENPFDIAWITSLSGHELHRFHYPSANEFTEQIRTRNDGTQPSQAPLRVSQIDIEPVLKALIDQSPLVDVRFDTAFERIIEEKDDHLVVEIKNQSSGKIDHVSCAYLAGCDGGGSRVRRRAGIELDGDMHVAGAYMVHFRSNDIGLLQKWGITWHYQTGSGTLIAQNDRDTWTLQAWLPPGDTGETWRAEEVLEAWVGTHFDYEILQANPWTAHFVVSQSYRKGRILLAGDAAHQYIPTGGYGMNSGIADAIGLAWVITANLQGWGGSALLDAYEQERRATAWQCLNASKRHMAVRAEIGRLYQLAGELEGADESAVARRESLAAQIAALGNAENESWGVELGYRYLSPVIACDEDTAGVVMDPLHYSPLTEAGFRLPHLFLENGESIHSKLGLQFSLIVFEDDIAADAMISLFAETASHMGVPLTVVKVVEDQAKAIFKKRYILVRPDQHIAWSGDDLPDNCEALLRKVTGR
ncbi:MAG: FAD-dependent monooxygenase [Pseudomonadota bacterium]|nr:FAD-dependent monooxygenase [Pseudomonadota bacterium]